MKRQKKSRSEESPVPFRSVHEQQMFGTLLLSCGLIGYTLRLEQLPIMFLPIVFFLAFTVYRTAARPETNLKLAQDEREFHHVLADSETQILPPVPDVRQWQHAVDEIGFRQKCKLDFTLSPLVYGPEVQILLILDACFPECSKSEFTLRDRQIILLGRRLYQSTTGDCNQKRFAGLVVRAYQAECAAQYDPKPGVSDDVCGRILAGSYDSVKGRLAKPVLADTDGANAVDF